MSGRGRAPVLTRVGLLLGLFAGGLATGLAAVALHTRPWGLPLVVLATLSGLLAVPPAAGSRLLAAAGWSTAVLAAVAGRPEGDVAVRADVAGWSLLVLCAVVVLVALLTLRRRAPGGPVPPDVGGDS